MVWVLVQLIHDLYAVTQVGQNVLCLLRVKVRVIRLFHTFLAKLDVDGWPDVVTRQAGAGASEDATVDGHHRSAGLLRFLGFAYQAGDASADTGDA